MPGKRYERSIKNKPMYHALRKKRYSKQRAAAISNAWYAYKHRKRRATHRKIKR